MPSNNKRVVIVEENLVQGYESTIENAIRLLGAADVLTEEFPDKALALAQLGQEEIGKSLTILAAFHLPAVPEAWNWFWEGWRGHRLKAHRAYIYEVINPLRIELSGPDGNTYDGGPLREPISREKEIGLYVDFDMNSNRFINPANEISSFEALARMSTLMYLSATADAVRWVMLSSDASFRLKEFGAIAFRICTETVYQQDMPEILDQFESRSLRHAAVVNDLQIAFSGVRALFDNANSKYPSQEGNGGT